MNARKEKLMLPFFWLGMANLLIITNNHSALFIADYYIFFLLFLAFSFFAIYAKHFMFKLNSVVKMVLALFVFMLIGTLFHITDIDNGTLLSYCLWFVILIVASQLKPNTKSLKFLMISFIVESLIFVLMFLIFKVDYVYQGSGRATIQFQSNVQIDPNYLANFMMVGIAFALYFLLNESKRYVKFFLWIMIISIFIGIVMTGSRAGVLCVIVLALGYFLQMPNNINDRKKYLILFITPLLLIVAVYGFLIFAPQEVITRYSISGLFDSSNARRIDHWYHAIQAAVKHPFGYGAMHTMTVLKNYTGSVADAHNTFLSLLLQSGFPGAIFFIIYFIKICKNLFADRHHKFFWIAVVLAFVINNTVISNQLGISFWITILILFYFSEGYCEGRKIC